jgi:L-ectoine synthase
MIIRSVADVIGTTRDVRGTGWRSRRLVLAEDGAPYSLHETTLDPGITLEFTYRSHRETVYCVSGDGVIEDLRKGRAVEFGPGSLYSAGIGEAHRITTRTQMVLVCVFSPPLAGDEVAD